MKTLSACLRACALLAWSSHAFGQLPNFVHHYTVTTLPFEYSDVALNDEGEVAGPIQHPDGSVSLGVWFKGVLTDHGTPSGIPSVFNHVQVSGINNCGAIVGDVETALGGLPSFSFVYDNGGFNVLRLATPGDLGGVAIAVNDAGTVVGYDVSSTDVAQAWEWSNGTYTILNVPGANSDATPVGINSSGVIAGDRSGPCCNGGILGFIVADGRTRLIEMAPNAINDAGELAGFSEKTGAASVFYEGHTRSLISTSSSAFAVNSKGIVVGFYYDKSGTEGLLRWSAEEGAVDLTPPGYTFATGAGINDAGQILGGGYTDKQIYRNFLLTPIRLALSDLLDELRGFGSGASLASQVELAEADYAANDIRETCAVFTKFEHDFQALTKTAVKRTPPAAKLIADADAIDVALACH